MTCDEAEILLHALIDGELDAGHAHEVEAHAADCSGVGDGVHPTRRLPSATRAMMTAAASK